jgi:hypothetical protein
LPAKLTDEQLLKTKSTDQRALCADNNTAAVLIDYPKYAIFKNAAPRI